MLAIPDGWPVKPGAVPSNQQADNPMFPDEFLRFGGSPAPAMPLVDSVMQSERSITSIREGYQRLRLADVPSTSAQEAVDWEFTFTKDGQFRHAYGRYWRTGGMDYVVYASAPDGTWSNLEPIIEVMVRTAGP